MRVVSSALEPADFLAAQLWNIHDAHGTSYDFSQLDPLMTGPKPVIASEIDYDATTGIVTADGVPYHLDIWLAAQVGSGRAHNINEAREEMGLPQDPTLPAAPDSSGNPSFTVTQAPGAVVVQSSAPSGPATAVAILPAPPHPSAPPAHHASFWSGLGAFVLHAAEFTGRSFENPAVVAVMPAQLQPEAAIIGGLMGAIDAASAAKAAAAPAT